MSRFPTADQAPVPYSEVKPERLEEPRGASFLMPGEDKPRQCGKDPDMPPASPRRYYERDVGLGYSGLKRR